MMSTVVLSGQPIEGLPGPGSPDAAGVALSLTGVTWRGGAAVDESLIPGVTLYVPPGQSVALYGEPPGDIIELLDVVSGRRAPLSGRVTAGDVAVDRLSGPALDRYRVGLGLLSARFPLVPSLSVIDNVLAVPADGQVDTAGREQAARLLAITGAADFAGPVGTVPAEQQWRILIARALRAAPRLVLAEDPTLGLDSRTAAAILDLIVDVHTQFGFTLLLAVRRLAAASYCQRLVRLADGIVIEDVLIGGDDPWTRGRVDRIG
jgi:putative ABC transport system ATP-binding protein